MSTKINCIINETEDIPIELRISIIYANSIVQLKSYNISCKPQSVTVFDEQLLWHRHKTDTKIPGRDTYKNAINVINDIFKDSVNVLDGYTLAVGHGIIGYEVRRNKNVPSVNPTKNTYGSTIINTIEEWESYVNKYSTTYTSSHDNKKYVLVDIGIPAFKNERKRKTSTASSSSSNEVTPLLKKSKHQKKSPSFFVAPIQLSIDVRRPTIVSTDKKTKDQLYTKTTQPVTTFIFDCRDDFYVSAGNSINASTLSSTSQSSTTWQEWSDMERADDDEPVFNFGIFRHKLIEKIMKCKHASKYYGYNKKVLGPKSKLYGFSKRVLIPSKNDYITKSTHLNNFITSAMKSKRNGSFNKSTGTLSITLSFGKVKDPSEAYEDGHFDEFDNDDSFDLFKTFSQTESPDDEPGSEYNLLAGGIPVSRSMTSNGSSSRMNENSCTTLRSAVNVKGKNGKVFSVPTYRGDSNGIDTSKVCNETATIYEMMKFVDRKYIPKKLTDHQYVLVAKGKNNSFFNVTECNAKDITILVLRQTIQVTNGSLSIEITQEPEIHDESGDDFWE